MKCGIKMSQEIFNKTHIIKEEISTQNHYKGDSQHKMVASSLKYLLYYENVF